MCMNGNNTSSSVSRFNMTLKILLTLNSATHPSTAYSKSKESQSTVISGRGPCKFQLKDRDRTRCTVATARRHVRGCAAQLGSWTKKIGAEELKLVHFALFCISLSA
jgi:hypothetical protein